MSLSLLSPPPPPPFFPSYRLIDSWIFSHKSSKLNAQNALSPYGIVEDGHVDRSSRVKKIAPPAGGLGVLSSSPPLMSRIPERSLCIGVPVIIPLSGKAEYTRRVSPKLGEVHQKVGIKIVRIEPVLCIETIEDIQSKLHRIEEASKRFDVATKDKVCRLNYKTTLIRSLLYSPLFCLTRCPLLICP